MLFRSTASHQAHGVENKLFELIAVFRLRLYKHARFVQTPDLLFYDVDGDLFRRDLPQFIRAEEVIDSHVEKVKKAYPAYFDTYREMDTLIDWLSSIKNLYCVGRNGQHRYNNMDHSMCTSFEAVKNILTGEENKSNIWKVNTEKEYHEEKPS